jgi:UDP-N-acetyl-D-glucosamine dehydrogenase
MTNNWKVEDILDSTRQKVVVQGIGFVGTAMIAALSQAKNQDNKLLYDVIGVDLPGKKSLEKINKINMGISPIVSTDRALDKAFLKANEKGNVFATTDESIYKEADVIVIDINLDIKKLEFGNSKSYQFSYINYMKAIDSISNFVSENTLILVESTVPPGTTEKVIYPRLLRKLAERNINPAKVQLAHSYERVMPGSKYLDSIINYYRVFSGVNEISKIIAEKFLKSFINTEKYPLRKLQNTTASEMSKVLENSYRAVNIAFIQEWTDFAEIAGVDLFEIIEAIRDRSTHKNIMAPGLGVGGYCLTKDALLADYGYNEIFGSPKRLEMSLEAVNINDLMPAHTFTRIKREIGELGNLEVGILGVSYLNDVGDTRFTPTGLLYDLLIESVNSILLFDPYISLWEEKQIAVITDMSAGSTLISLLIFAVKHSEFKDLSTASIISLFPSLKYVVDANNVLKIETIKRLRDEGIVVLSLGRGIV